MKYLNENNPVKNFNCLTKKHTQNNNIKFLISWFRKMKIEIYKKKIDLSTI